MLSRPNAVSETLRTRELMSTVASTPWPTPEEAYFEASLNIIER